MKTDMQLTLDYLITEIENTDPTLFKPPHDVQKSDKVLGTIEDTFLIKLFNLLYFSKRGLDHMQTNLTYEPDNKTLLVDGAKLESKSELLRSMFWHLLRERFSVWDTNGLNIRKGWVVVETPVRQNFIKEFFL